MLRKTLILAILLSLAFIIYWSNRNQTNLPVIAIANYGPHSSLQESIEGLKDELARQGYKEGEQVHFEIADVNFEQTLIPQMLAKLKASKPIVIVTQSTPVGQVAKNSIKNIPLIFADITDPVETGLLSAYDKPQGNATAASDKQDLGILLQFAQQLLPHAKTVGMLYGTSDANDVALVKMMKEAAIKNNMEMLAIPVEQARDVPLRVQNFKNKADFIYVGTSGPIQPTLPAIVAAADKMGIPIFNADSDAVKKHQVLGSFGVRYYQVGVHAARMVVRLLKSEAIENIAPYYPQADDHQGFISKVRADKLGIAIPPTLTHVTVVE